MLIYLMMKSQRGTALIQSLVALGIIVPAMLLMTSTITKSSKRDSHVKETLLYQTYASELLEYFLSQKTKRLEQYLSVNPVDAAKLPYLYCAHVNILERAFGVMVNGDALAALPSTIPSSHPEFRLSPNRYYQISVVNLDTMTVNKMRCKERPGAVPLNDNERFLITVGVSWVPSGKTREDVKRIVLSGVLTQ